MQKDYITNDLFGFKNNLSFFSWSMFYCIIYALLYIICPIKYTYLSLYPNNI